MLISSGLFSDRKRQERELLIETFSNHLGSENEKIEGEHRVGHPMF